MAKVVAAVLLGAVTLLGCVGGKAGEATGAHKAHRHQCPACGYEFEAPAGE